MARKSKRLVLNEAIRQGQAKIQEGLKDGTLRSDRERFEAEIEGDQGGLKPEKPSPFKQKSDALKSKDRISLGGIWLSRQKVWMYAASVVGLAVVIWIAMAGFKGKSSSDVNKPVSESSGNTVQGSQTAIVDQAHDNAPGVISGQSNNDPVQEYGNVDTETPVITVDSTGDNVIWIASIPPDRKNELLPVQKFFHGKGIETEIIIAEGKAALVTKAGFEQNPVKQGTQGYTLYRQVKQLGSVYVLETEDTKFGPKPFQDVYGYKRK